MKLNKKILKSIVKECLVEILAEGLVQGGDKPFEKRKALQENIKSASRTIDKRPIARESNKYHNNSKNLQSRGSYLDQVSFNNPDNQQRNHQDSSNGIDQKTMSMVSRVTSDPIMSEILADTAATTLREQRESSTRTSMPSKPADEAARIVAATDPTDLFGSSANKWADLAFAPKINR